jgi:LysR family transcriptional regulator of gallate degradation
MDVIAQWRRWRHWPASIRHLKVFDSVAHLHGVQRASEECHVSQPAVTQAIAKLEQQMGVALLQRCSRGTYPNEFGVIFHRRTQRFFAQLEAALLELGVPNAPVPLSRIAGRISRSQLLSLISIVEHGSFVQAAHALEMSPAWLQRAARDLERIVRRPLFAQTASGIVATPAAAEFARRIKLAQREIEFGIDELQTAMGNSGGEIVIGAMRVANSIMLASVVNEFASSYPNANIRILIGSPREMLRSLRCGDVDALLGLLRDPDSSDLIQAPLGEMPYVVAARHGHPLVQRESVTLEDLARFEWVVGSAQGGRRARFDKLFAAVRKPLVRIEASSLPTLRLLLAQSDRLTLLTSYELMCEEDTLTAIRFAPIEPVPWFGLTTRENWLPTARQASFMDLIQKHIVRSLMPTRESQLAAACSGPPRKRQALTSP